MMRKNSTRRAPAMMAIACACVLGMLGGCSSKGLQAALPLITSPHGPGGNDGRTQPPADGTNPTNPPTVSKQNTATGEIAEHTGNTVHATGHAVTQIGRQVQDANLPILSEETGFWTGQVAVDAGLTVSALGTGVREGLGRMGEVENPVGITVASTGKVVTQSGHTLSSTGDLVTSLGQDQLKILRPVTGPTGALINHVAHGVRHLGEKLEDKLSSGAVEKLTLHTSKVIVPLTSKLTDTTQALGDKTGLGKPVDHLLEKVGRVVADTGTHLNQTRAPVIGPLGGAVHELGRTIGVAGVLVHDERRDHGSHHGLGQLLGGLPLLHSGGRLDGSGHLLGGLPLIHSDDRRDGGGHLLGGLLGGLPIIHSGENPGGSNNDNGAGSGKAGGALAPVGGLLAPVTGLLGTVGAIGR